ncbi:MAG: proton-conducting transporter membrane subunit [Anaerolineales bacterium]|jgi:formate hydrogenlyase subunit 3/multisubunit Na+/H+ antiporter MnhD subunit
MNAPLVLMVGTLALAIAVLALEKRPRACAATAAIGAGLLGIFAMTAPLDSPFPLMGAGLKLSSEWELLGRRLVMDASNRSAVGFLYLSGAFIMGGSWMANAGRHFAALGLACLAVLANSLLIRPFLFAAIVLELAAMCAVLILVSSSAGRYRGALRLLSLYTLAMMVILFTGWLLEIEGVTSGTPELAQRATLLLAFGFAILMGVPPFHLWLPTAGDESDPFGLTFVGVVLQSAAFFFVLQFMESYDWLRDNDAFLQGVRIAGMGMVFLGGLWAMVQKSLGKLMAYALLADFGVSLLAMGAGTPDGYQLSLGILSARVIGLALCALGLVVARRSSGWESTDEAEGAAHAAPLASAAVVVGLMSIGGFPLTAGFPGRWALLGVLAEIDVLAASSILFAFFAIGAAVIRWLSVATRRSKLVQRAVTALDERILLFGGMGICVLLGAFPQSTFLWVARAASGLPNLVP